MFKLINSFPMIDIFIITIFVLGYLAVAVEHKININKTATVLLMAVACWVLLGIKDYLPHTAAWSHGTTITALNEHLQQIAQIVFFLIGAMTIVHTIDAHNGFKVVTDVIRTKDQRKLLWAISFITFFLSAVLDNLTTAIVMTSLLHRLLSDKKDRMIFAAMVIIAANAGGAWSPIGDVTTTMLWIGGQITSGNIIRTLFLPSLVSLLVPLIYFSSVIKKEFTSAVSSPASSLPATVGAKRIFFLGVGALIFVPVFKGLSHLPPFMGMLLGLGIIWLVTDILHQAREHLRIPHILSKIDVSSILFFLGILLAVAALDTAGILKTLAGWMDVHWGNKDLIVTALGLLSAIVDNVPLTAAAMGMYDLSAYPVDSRLWELIAYAVGTGGSILIIGSAAGVVVMGMEKINFAWYLRKVSLPALAGYFAGIFTYVGLHSVIAP